MKEKLTNIVFNIDFQAQTIKVSCHTEKDFKYLLDEIARAIYLRKSD